MSRLLKRCTACRDYTLQETCVHCGGRALVNRPPKYGPEDPYGSYRRRLKKLDAAEAKARGAGRAPEEAPAAEQAGAALEGPDA